MEMSWKSSDVLGWELYWELQSLGTAALPHPLSHAQGCQLAVLCFSLLAITHMLPALPHALPALLQLLGVHRGHIHHSEPTAVTGEKGKPSLHRGLLGSASFQITPHLLLSQPFLSPAGPPEVKSFLFFPGRSPRQNPQTCIKLQFIPTLTEFILNWDKELK